MKNNMQPEIRFDGFSGDWEQRKLLDLKDINDKYSYTGGPFGSDLKSSDYTKNGIRIVQLQNIGDGYFVNNYKIYTSEEKAESLQSNYIYPGEIIIAKMADPLARATIMPDFDSKYLMASDGIRLKINKDLFDNYFVLTLINSKKFRGEALNNSTGTTRKRIGLVTLGNLPVILPITEEQTQIGTFFKQLDDAIIMQQRQLERLKDSKQGFLQKMFPKEGESVPEFRFSGFVEDWGKRELDEISNKITKKNTNRKFSETLTNSAKFGIVSQKDFFDKEISNINNIDSYYIVQPDDFVYNPRISNHAPVGPISRNKLGRTGVMSPLYYVFKTENIIPTYLETYFKTTYWHKFMVLNGDSGARSDRFAIKDSVFKKMPIPYATIKEQQKIGGFFKQLDDTITLHEKELELLKETKKAFLQKMFV